MQENSRSEPRIGPIIGGALGALTFICIVLLYLRQRQREGHANENLCAPPPIGKNSQFLQYLKWLIIPVSCLSPIQAGRHHRSLAPMIFRNPHDTETILQHRDANDGSYLQLFQWTRIHFISVNHGGSYNITQPTVHFWGSYE